MYTFFFFYITNVSGTWWCPGTPSALSGLIENSATLAVMQRFIVQKNYVYPPGWFIQLLDHQKFKYVIANGYKSNTYVVWELCKVDGFILYKNKK